MFENFETLLRSILEYPSKPAVIIVQSFKLDGVMSKLKLGQSCLASCPTD